MISSYGDQSTARNNQLFIIIITSCLNCSECFRDTLFYTYNYNIRVTHRNGAIKHILHESDPRRDLIGCSLFILSLHALALHLAVKILLQIFSVWRFEHVIAIHLSVVFPSRMPAGPHFVTQPILLSENIPNIWHKSSTKHKEEQTRLKR